MALRGSSRTVFREGLVSWAGDTVHTNRDGQPLALPPLFPDRQVFQSGSGIHGVFGIDGVSGTDLLPDSRRADQGRGQPRRPRNLPGHLPTIQQRDRRAAQAADHGLLFALREDLGSALCYFGRVSNSVIMRMDTT